MRRPAALRARLTLVFAAATAVVLAVVGVLVVGLFSSSIKGTVDSSLVKRQRTLKLLARDEADPQELRADSGERLLQLYRPDGTLLATSLELRRRNLLSPRQVARAADHPISADRDHLPDEAEVRIRAFPVARGRIVAMIGESLDRDHDLRVRLVLLLGLALPGALLLAAYLGYRVAGAALAPVERMRAQAARITETDLQERLPVPATDDEIARLGLTFNELLDRLAAAVESERRVVSDASHELRTPLAVLRAELEVAARDDRTREQLHVAVVSALEETGRLSRLADDVLVLARADQGRLPLRLEPVDVADVLRDLRRRNAAAVAAAGRSLRTHVDVAGGAVVLADPDRVAQLLDNLLANALGHGAGPIDVRASLASDGRVALSVADDGPGFGAALPHAFERFSQGDPAHGGSSSGLGLAIVDAIARAHGGTATAADRPEGGAVVTVELPAA